MVSNSNGSTLSKNGNGTIAQPRKVQRILLVQPNMRWVEWNFKTLWEIHPLNLCMIAATVEDRYEISILDANIDDLSQDEFRSKVIEIAPDLVGITLLTMEYGKTAHICSSLVKQADPNIVTILGGIYVTQAHDIAGADENLDYLVLGEGEYTFPALLDYIEGKGPRPELGIGYWQDGKRIVQPKPPFIQDLDSLPLPAYHLADFDRYTTTLQRISVDSPRALPYARMITSRGCPVGCTFCEVESISGGPFRTRSVEHVMSELRYMKQRYGIKAVVWDDDNLFLKRSRTKALFRAMIDEKLDLKWNGLAVPVFTMTDEIIEIFAESGCQYLDFAIESGVDRILKDIVHKPVNLETVAPLVAKAQSLGIDVNCHFIIGFPGETWDEIRQTISYAESLQADYTKFFIYQPLPHTPLGDKLLADGMIKGSVNVQSDLNWSESVVVSDDWSTERLRYLRAFEWDRINFNSQEKKERIAKMMSISMEQLEQLRNDTLDSVAPVSYPAIQKEVPEPMHARPESMANITYG
jgi:anaerobic magnesium-protoporphyrin IX monomethyl ester cyclase